MGYAILSDISTVPAWKTIKLTQKIIKFYCISLAMFNICSILNLSIGFVGEEETHADSRPIANFI
ncbi:MAG: hypothetical protein PVI75_01045 [Gammaproteobacteria bacterium]|jgi:hypothetical protein